MTYKRKTDRPKKLFSDPEKLILLWRWMDEFFKKHQAHASNREIVDAGFCGSTNTVRYYYDAMSEYNMLERRPNVARGIWLNKPAKFHPIVKELLEKEKQNERENSIPA